MIRSYAKLSTAQGIVQQIQNHISCAGMSSEMWTAILYMLPCPQATPRFYLAAFYLHSCEIKLGVAWKQG